VTPTFHIRDADRLRKGLARGDPRRGTADTGADGSALAWPGQGRPPPVQNMDEFSQAFDITECDGMHLPPEKRIVIR